MRSLLIATLSLILLSCRKKAAVDTMPPDVMTVLKKGINLSNWFNDYSDPGQFDNRFTAATLQTIKANGFTYVRIPIGSTILFNPANPSQLNPVNLVKVDAAVNKCISNGLAVMLNLHPGSNTIDSLLANDASFPDKLAAYWKSVALIFKKYASDKIFFEVYNEPHASAAGLTTSGFAWWQNVQGKLISAVREASATHYIIAGGEGWNSMKGLFQLTPYPDNRVIYNFHFYDPFLFTHQGATWAGWQPAIDARNVPYPSSPAAVAPLIAGSSNTVLNDALRWYGDQRYSIDSIDSWIKQAADWGNFHQIKIICNEFGSYMPYAPRTSRLQWIRDVRATLEKYKIGWAMWECDEGFGWINYPGGNRNNPVVDENVLVALGVKL
ncbi:MAG: cellulase family glycosylhydrolase [Bacteroidetes bacterium]|nr:cellulase family glycosylhydrolase [Bacteroidota bacterium]